MGDTYTYDDTQSLNSALDSLPPEYRNQVLNVTGAFAGTAIAIYIIALIWIIAGIAAFIMSLICFGKSGTTTDHVLGLVLAILFGPIYFLFFIFNKSYCRNKNKNA